MAESATTGAVAGRAHERGPGRGDPAKRAVILAAATSVFIRQGFARASVDAIAAEAGVSKPTVYKHFGDKEGLFLAVIDAARANADAAYDIDERLLRDPARLEADLVSVGRRFLRIVLDEDVSALRRLIIAEVGHHAQLHRSCDTGPPPRLVTWFAARVAELTAGGVLCAPDAERAAAQFVSLLAYEGQQRSSYGTAPLSAAETRRISQDAAEMFLRAYRGDRRPGPGAAPAHESGGEACTGAPVRAPGRRGRRA